MESGGRTKAKLNALATNARVRAVCMHWPLAALYVLCCLLFLGLHTLGSLDAFSNRISQPLLFKFRESITQQSHQLDERIQIFAFDDLTVESVKHADLPTDLWLLLIERMFAAGASQVAIDKVFRMKDISEAKLKALQEKNSSWRERLTSIGWVEPATASIPTDVVRQAQSQKGGAESADKHEWTFRGPHPELRDVLGTVSHAVYRGDGVIIPSYQTREGQAYHISFVVGQKALNIPIEELRMRFSKDRAQPMHINLPSRKHLEQNTFSMRPLIARLKLQQSLSDIIKPGAIVIILPAMLTGKTDYVMTPIGYIPGGWLVASSISNVLKGQWVQVVAWPSLSIMLATALGLLVNRRTSMRQWLILVLGLFLGFSLLAVLAFFYANSLIPLEAIIGPFVLSAAALRASILYKERLKQERHEAERQMEDRLAQTVQQTLLERRHTIPGIIYKSYYRPATIASGDWYGVFNIRDHLQLFIIADVTGHGFASALVTGVISGVVRRDLLSFASDDVEGSLLRLGQAINRIVHETGAHAEKCATMNMVCIDTREQTAYVMNAGHCVPFLVHENNVGCLMARGNILGLEPDWSAKVTKRVLQPGTLIFLYTDGLVENTDSEGEVIKPRELRKILGESRSAENLHHAISQYLERKWGDYATADDTCFLVIEIAKPSTDDDSSELLKSA